MSQQDKKMPLPSIDSFFLTQEERDDMDKEKVTEINITDIDEFPNHPFKVINNEEMQQMKESILENGVLLPILVRPKPNGRYEIISGHRRKFASQLAEKTTIPCIIRNLTDDEATIIMVDSNMQREKILPSEKAFAYKMKIDALSHQGQRNDLTSTQDVPKLRTNELVGQEHGDSREKVRRLVRLTKLIPELLQMVDDERIALSPAVYISYLTEDEQTVLLDCIECNDATPNVSQALELKKLSEEGKLTDTKIDNILSKEKPNQKPKIELDESKIRSVLPEDIEAKKIEDFLVNAVDKYQKIKKVIPNIEEDKIDVFVTKAITYYMKYMERQKNKDAR
ncbi:MAG: ParB/RepB/Spo0J family partition protein [bacterium]|nr:ParB/RepB/Spo0J family partition protein [bacterium]